MTTFYTNAPRSAHGRSLIELMVGILIGSLVLAGVLIITAGTSNIGRRTDSLGGLSDSGQTAVQLLASDVRMAGYSMPRTYFAAGYATKMLFTAGIRGCDAGFVDSKVATLGALTCQPGISSSGSALSIAYEADAYNSIYVNTDDGLVPSDCRGFGLVPIAGGIKGNVSRPDVAQDNFSDPAYWLVENRYYITNSGPDNEPSLVCAGNGGKGAAVFASYAMIRGVERMVASYGVAADSTTVGVDATRDTVLTITNPSVTRYYTAKEIDEKWPGELADMRWQRVVSVRLCLELRGAPGTAVSTDGSSSFINCDGTTKAIEDTRARRAVRMTINLRNRTMGVDRDSGLGLGGV